MDNFMEVEEVRLSCDLGQGHGNDDKGQEAPSSKSAAVGSYSTGGVLDTNCGNGAATSTTIGVPVSVGVGPGTKEPDDEIKFLEVVDHSQDSYSKSSIDRKSDLKRCDCLTENCPGCHYPCSNCGSRFCGHACKLLRDWHYEEVIVQGHDVKRKSPLGPNH